MSKRDRETEVGEQPSAPKVQCVKPNAPTATESAAPTKPFIKWSAKLSIGEYVITFNNKRVNVKHTKGKYIDCSISYANIAGTYIVNMHSIVIKLQGSAIIINYNPKFMEHSSYEGDKVNKILMHTKSLFIFKTMIDAIVCRKKTMFISYEHFTTFMLFCGDIDTSILTLLLK